MYGPQVHLGRNDSFLVQNITLQNTVKHFNHVKHSQIGAISLNTIVLHTHGKEFNLKLWCFHCPAGRTFKEPLKKIYRIMFYKDKECYMLNSWPDYLFSLSLFHTIWKRLTANINQVSITGRLMEALHNSQEITGSNRNLHKPKYIMKNTKTF